MNCPFLSVPKEKKGKVEYKHFQCMKEKCTFYTGTSCILAEKPSVNTDSSAGEAEPTGTGGKIFESRLEALENRIVSNRTAIEEMSKRTFDFLEKMEKTIEEEKKEREESMSALRNTTRDNADYVVKKLDKMNEAATARLEDFAVKVPDSIKSALDGNISVSSDSKGIEEQFKAFEKALTEKLEAIVAKNSQLSADSSETVCITPSATDSLEKLLKSELETLSARISELHEKEMSTLKESASSIESHPPLNEEKLLENIRLIVEKSTPEQPDIGEYTEKVTNIVRPVITLLENQIKQTEAALMTSESNISGNIESVRTTVEQLGKSQDKFSVLTESLKELIAETSGKIEQSLLSEMANSTELLKNIEKLEGDNGEKLEQTIREGFSSLTAQANTDRDSTTKSRDEILSLISTIKTELSEGRAKNSEELKSSFTELDKKFTAGITAVLNHIKGSHEAMQKFIRAGAETNSKEREQFKSKVISSFGTATDKLVALHNELSQFREEEKLSAQTRQQENSLITGYFESYRKQVEEERAKEQKIKAKEHNDKGALLFHKGAWEASEKEFAKAISLDPALWESYNNLGLVCSEQGKEKEAVEHFRKAVELAPEQAEIFNNLGLVYHNCGDYNKAIVFFRKSIERNIDFSKAYTNLGNTFYELKKFEDAVKAWQKSLELDPTNQQAKHYLESFRKTPAKEE